MIFPSEVVQALLFSILRPDKSHTFSVRNSVIEADRALVFLLLLFFLIFFNCSDHSAFEIPIFLSQTYPLNPVLKGDATKVILDWKF